MVDQKPLNPESSPRTPESLTERRTEHAQDRQTLKGVTIDMQAILETAEPGDEGGAESMGHVSEQAREGIGEQRQASGGRFQQFQQQLTKEEAAALKAKLLESPPTRKQMVDQIRHHVHREIEHLEVIARGCERQGKFRELADALSRIRQLRILLRDLLHATANFVKNTWLKVVHGIV